MYDCRIRRAKKEDKWMMEEWSYTKVEGWIKVRNHPHKPPIEYVWIKPKELKKRING